MHPDLSDDVLYAVVNKYVRDMLKKEVDKFLRTCLSKYQPDYETTLVNDLSDLICREVDRHVNGNIDDYVFGKQSEIENLSQLADSFTAINLFYGADFLRYLREHDWETVLKEHLHNSNYSKEHLEQLNESVSIIRKMAITIKDNSESIWPFFIGCATGFFILKLSLQLDSKYLRGKHTSIGNLLRGNDPEYKDRSNEMRNRKIVKVFESYVQKDPVRWGSIGRSRKKTVRHFKEHEPNLKLTDRMVRRIIEEARTKKS